MLKRDDRFEILSEADDGASALSIIKNAIPDIVLMDVSMSGMSGIETTREMLATYPELKIIMFTASEKEEDLFETVKAGTRGYILKTATNSKSMRDAIYRVAAGDAIIPPAMVPRLLSEFAFISDGRPRETSKEIEKESLVSLPEQPTKLTPREYQVLELVAQSLTNKEVAKELTISENTIRSHLGFILNKLHMNNRVQAALWFQKKNTL